MDMLIIDQRGAQLTVEAKAIVIRVSGRNPASVPLNQVSRLVIAASVQLNSTLLTHLAEQGVTVVVMPGRGVRRNAILYGMGHGDAARRLQQYALQQETERVLFWAKRFVSMRIYGALRLLRHAKQQRPDCRYPLNTAIRSLSQALLRVQLAEELAELRGIEGAASARFFTAYQTLFPESLGFLSRNRRPPRDPVNAALSLGYTLLHGDAVKAVTQSGLDPMLGFLHDISYGRESLACDLVELARPRIERFVWGLFSQQLLRDSHFSVDGEACRMMKAARRIYFSNYEAQAHVHRRWFSRYAQMIARQLSASETAFSTIAEKGP